MKKLIVLLTIVLACSWTTPAYAEPGKIKQEVVSVARKVGHGIKYVGVKVKNLLVATARELPKDLLIAIITLEAVPYLILVF